MTPQPSSPTASGRAAGLTLVHWPAATSVLSAKAPMPRAGESGVPSASVIFCVALWVAKQYQGRPRRQARHSPHTARQLRTTKSPGARSVTPGPTDSTTPAASWPEEEGEVVVDAALAVVQVGVADAARLDGDDRLARPGVGHQDRLDGDGRALLPGDHTARLGSHACSSPSGSSASSPSPHDARSAGRSAHAGRGSRRPIVTRNGRGLRARSPRGGGARAAAASVPS